MRFFVGEMMKIWKNAYYDAFTCLAGACPDSCCKEWEVLVDGASAKIYKALNSPLGERLRSVMRLEDGQVYMTIENGRCPMWQEDGLCRIQKELGHGALCKTCREFPRLTHDYGDFVELGLELSCPEAARLLLSSDPKLPVVTEAPGGMAEYDADAMQVLLRTRNEARTLLLEPRPMGETLAIFLLYVYYAQGQLDGDEEGAFDPDAALSGAKSLRKNGESREILAFFKGLEILTDAWKARLDAPQYGTWSAELRRMAVYCVERYWLQAISDYDLVSRGKMAVISCLLVKILGGDPVQTAQLWSKEIENSTENVEALLDGAYADPALTDGKLLGLLLEE